MHSIYYTMGFIICLPYIIYVVIKNNGDLIGTIKHLKITWGNTAKDNKNKNYDIQYKIRITLFFSFIGLGFIGLKSVKIFSIIIAIILLVFIIYYIINPLGVLKHVIYQLKQLYPLPKKVDNN